MRIKVEFYLDDGNDDDDGTVKLLRMRRRIRDACNPLELPPKQFIKLFRLNKEAFRYLLDEIKDHLNASRIHTNIPHVVKLCGVLRFLAEGTSQQATDDEFNMPIARPTFFEVLKDILSIIEGRVCHQWIKSKMSETEKSEMRMAFYTASGFPSVLGCIDSMHVRVVPPNNDQQHIFINPKGFFSLNVMIVCDHNMVIRFVDASNYGSLEESLIFLKSSFRTFIEGEVDENGWILGDCDFPLFPYLMTPYRDALPNSRKARYNKAHAKVLITIHKTIGLLKSRFRCLAAVGGLHYPPRNIGQIINVCCALHNICHHYNAEFDGDILLDNERSEPIFDEDFIDDELEAATQ